VGVIGRSAGCGRFGDVIVVGGGVVRHDDEALAVADLVV
jgi:hypothetical protein